MVLAASLTARPTAVEPAERVTLADLVTSPTPGEAADRTALTARSRNAVLEPLAVSVSSLVLICWMLARLTDAAETSLPALLTTTAEATEAAARTTLGDLTSTATLGEAALRTTLR
jgi:hypothetical protein